MNPVLICIVTIIYFIVAIGELRAANYGLTIFLLGCAVANGGIMMMTKG